jgi:chemotaxis signal transduction protein
MTAVFVPESSSRFVRTDVPGDDAAAPPRRPGRIDSRAADATVPEGATGEAAAAPGTAAVAAAPSRARRAPSFRAAPDPVVSAPVAEAAAEATVEGYVLFQVGGTTFAVSVGEVREIVRAARLELLPEARAAYGHGVALVDARGRSVPVVDLRSDRDSLGDVLLPMWRHQVGLVVDRVVAVQTPRDLVPEHDDVPAALPSYSRGVLRPVDGGDPVLLIAMPDAAELEADLARAHGQGLGDDVLGSLAGPALPGGG